MMQFHCAEMLGEMRNHFFGSYKLEILWALVQYKSLLRSSFTWGNVAEPRIWVGCRIMTLYGSKSLATFKRNNKTRLSFAHFNCSLVVATFSVPTHAINLHLLLNSDFWLSSHTLKMQREKTSRIINSGINKTITTNVRGRVQSVCQSVFKLVDLYLLLNSLILKNEFIRENVQWKMKMKIIVTRRRRKFSGQRKCSEHRAFLWLNENSRE